MTLDLNRVVEFIEVNFEDTDWEVGKPDANGCRVYTADTSGSSVTITRRDGKVLDWDPGRGTHIMICENVVSFHSKVNELPFK
jgi:hypothetical protein